MTQTCRTCRHPKREKIEAAILAGQTIRGTALAFDLTPSSVDRHARHCIKRDISVSRKRKMVSDGDSILDKVGKLEAEARRLKAKAEKKGDIRTALSAVRELTRICELMAKLHGELKDGPTVNVAIVQSLEWQQLRTRIVSALAPHPDAQNAVLQVLT